MKRLLAGAAAAAVLLAGAFAGTAEAKQTIRFAYLMDPSHEAVLYALKQGLVESDLIEVEATSMAIPALIQATAARSHDVIQTAAMAIPRAAERGLDLKIMGAALRYHEQGEGADIWVTPDSPIQSVDDLRGKTLGVYSIGSAGITLVRIALWKSYGLDVSLEDGDLEIVEIPAPSLPGALASGRIDAATLIHRQAFDAQQSGDFRSIARTAQDNSEALGVRMVSAVLAGYPDRLEAEPEAYREFIRLLIASREYALENREEVFTAVGEETDTPPEFFEAWFTRFSDFPATLSDDDVRAIELLWELSTEMGVLDGYPDIETVIWADAVRE